MCLWRTNCCLIQGVTVGSEGKKVELGKVLSNPDIAVLIEGHTDDDAFTASGPIADN
jgi:chemotaxis protein MotB